MKKYIEIQKEFQKKLHDIDSMSHEEKVKLSKDFILSAHKELSEVLDCFKWKTHRNEDKNFVSSNLREELVDVFKFFVNLLVLWDINAEEFDKTFDDKTEVVEQRYKQEHIGAKPGEKVCAVDLDDVLNEWHEFFVKTYNEKNGTNFKTDAEIRDATNPLKYYEFKHWWRDSGVKMGIPPKNGAAELTALLKRNGYRIVVISSRPYKEYSRLFSDTISWLRQNNIAFDDVYFDENKHLTILRHFPSLHFMIEDNYSYAKHVAHEGYDVFLLDQDGKYDNEKLSPKIIKVKSIQEIIEKFS